MWRSAVQVCLGLLIAVRQCVQAVQVCLGLLIAVRQCVQAAILPGTTLYFAHGGLAQLARAPALQAGGHRFESDILHLMLNILSQDRFQFYVLRHTVQTVNNRKKLEVIH